MVQKVEDLSLFDVYNKASLKKPKEKEQSAQF